MLLFSSINNMYTHSQQAPLLAVVFSLSLRGPRHHRVPPRGSGWIVMPFSTVSTGRASLPSPAPSRRDHVASGLAWIVMPVSTISSSGRSRFPVFTRSKPSRTSKP